MLSGIEELREAGGQPRGVAQTWVCRLWTPENGVGFRVRDTCQHGARMPKSGIRDAAGMRGRLVVGTDFVAPLQRHTLCAEVHYYQMATFPAGRLVDCHIEWMSHETFELGGLLIWEGHGEHPQRLERAGWLCELDTKESGLNNSKITPDKGSAAGDRRR